MNKLNKKTTIIIIIGIIISIVIYYFFIKDEDYIESNTNLDTLSENTKNEINIIDTKEKIYITGGIKNEGVYEIEENTRIIDCIEKAGGLTEKADIANINLAYLVEDGMKIYIPKKGEENTDKIEDNKYIQSTNNNQDTNNQNSSNAKNEINNKNKNKININTATQTELETLPGIGPSIALKIINYKKEKGKFNNIEEIKNVSGIGENKYNQIKDLIKI